MKKPVHKNLAERAKELMDELHDIDLVSSALNKPVKDITKALKGHRPNPHLIYPGHVLAEMYANGDSIITVHKKTGITVRYIQDELIRHYGYKTYNELHGKIQYHDLVKQAAFIAGRDALIAKCFKEGWDTSSLAVEFGLKKYFIYEVLGHAGFKFNLYALPSRRSAKWKEFLHESIYDDYKNGKSIFYLAEKHRRSEKSIQQIISMMEKKNRAD